jgi:hypothetical protein
MDKFEDLVLDEVGIVLDVERGERDLVGDATGSYR